MSSPRLLNEARPAPQVEARGPEGFPAVVQQLGSAFSDGLIDEFEFVVQSRLAGHGPTSFAGLSKHVDLTLVSWLEFGSGAVAMRYAPRR